MDVSRRSFLRGALTVAAASLVPVAAAKALGLDDVPTLWGDGVHDDAPALQALIDGKPFKIAGEGFIARNGAETAFIDGGDYALSNGLVFRKGGRKAAISNASFRTLPEFPENGYVLKFEHGRNPSEIRNVFFNNRLPATPAS